MQAMQHSMQEGRNDHAGDYEEEHAGEQGVYAGKDLRRVVRKDIDRTHAAQDHRRVQEGIDRA
jgi:hypothetical protein